MADERSAVPGWDFGWLASALLLLFLSLMPRVIPAADAIPETAPASDTPTQARPHNRLVVFMIDGLGYRKFEQHMPRLAARAKTSAFGMALAPFPTITPSGLRAIFSGHRMVAEPQLPTGMQTPGEADSVMKRADTAGLNGFAVAQFTWPPLFVDGHGADLTIVPYDGIKVHFRHDGKKELLVDYDKRVFSAARPILDGRKGKWDLLILHLFEADSVGHAVGTEDALYSDYLLKLDGEVDDLARKIERESPTTFLLVGDHGQAPDGTHGGTTNVERQVPLMLWGAGIKPGRLPTLPLYDVAPTMTAILGIPPPSQAEGWPVTQALTQTDAERAERSVDMLRQRERRWLGVRAAMPWVAGDPSTALKQIAEARKKGNARSIAAWAERAALGLDDAMQDALPERWLWRLIASLWALALAACFGLAWHAPLTRMTMVTAALCAACLGLAVFPLLRPTMWAWASGLVLAASAAVAATTLASGFGKSSRLDGVSWCLWWFAMAGIAAREFIDVTLWAWLVLGGLFLARSLRLTPETRRSTALALAAALTCAALACGMPSPETSLLRSLLPIPQIAAVARVRWPLVASALALLLAGGAAIVFLPGRDRTRARVALACCAGPFLLAAAVMTFRPSGAWAVWVACLASMILLAVYGCEDRLAGYWLSGVALAYFRTLADERAWCMLALATAAGWALAWRSRDGHPLWEGLGLLCLGLWGFKLCGGQLTFSNITVVEGSRALGNGWHPYALFLLLTIKPLSMICAPILPRLAIRPLYTVLGIVPLLGALSAGNLSMLWWSRFMTGSSAKLTDDIGYARTLFVLVLTWTILGSWTILRGLERLSRRPAAVPAPAK